MFRYSPAPAQNGWAWLFAYGLLFGWPVTLVPLVSLHVLVTSVFAKRAYTLRSACWCGPATVLLNLLVLGLVQACFYVKETVEGKYRPVEPSATTALEPLDVVQSGGWALLGVAAAGLLLSIPHYLSYQRESRRT